LRRYIVWRIESVSEAAAVTATGRAMAAVIDDPLRAAIEAEPRPY